MGLTARQRAQLAEVAAGDGRSRNGDQGPRLRPYDVAQMVRQEPPEVPWVVEGLVVAGTLTVLNGREGEGKSLLMMALAAGVQSGQVEAGLECREGQALIIDAENGPYEFHRRVRTLELPPRVLAYEADGFDLRELGELEAVLDEHRPDLLVLDSFRSLWRGEENDSAEVAGVLDPLRALVRDHGAGTILLHHSGRTNGNQYRGSSAIGASTELGFTLAREPEDPDRMRRYLHCWKCRPAPEPSRRWLRLSAEEGRVFIEEADAPEAQTTTPAAPVVSQLLPKVRNLLSGDPRTRAEIARALDPPRDPKDRSVGRALEALRRAGEAEKTTAGWQVAGWQPPLGALPPATPEGGGEGTAR